LDVQTTSGGLGDNCLVSFVGNLGNPSNPPMDPPFETGAGFFKLPGPPGSRSSKRGGVFTCVGSGLVGEPLVHFHSFSGFQLGG